MNITQEDAEGNKNYLIKMYTIYEKAVSPTRRSENAISCALEYQPTYTKKNRRKRGAHFYWFANDRLVFGACAGDLITNRSAVVMFIANRKKTL